MTKGKSLAVIVPTFNEAKNIEKLIGAIQKNIGVSDKVIIVDDSSPDGTGKIVEDFAKGAKNIYVIHRKGKEGRGSAVLAGFAFARKFKPDYYLEMDADFSHKPEDISLLIGKLQKGFDVVIGSRYLAGSRIENWPPQRKIFSRFANFYAKCLLNVPISDYTNGFRIYSSKAANFLMSQKLVTKGYILLSETAFKLNKKFTFGEIPIIFVNRKRGQSNTNLKEITDAFLGILKIRFPEVFNRF